MSDGFGTGIPNRKASNSRALQNAFTRMHAPNMWSDNEKVGKIIGWTGIEGGQSASSMKNVNASKGGVWLKVQLFDGGDPITVWCEDSISKIMSEAGGNLKGKTVKCYYRGESLKDISNGYAKLLGSEDELYAHPESINPVSVGAFNGASIHGEAFGVFAGSAAAGEKL